MNPDKDIISIMNICEVCKKLLDECVCCPECGHICPLDLGEPFCPLCKPEPKKTEV